ncbi:MAG: hypothetical protein Q9160_004324 [Pyrenula sp. 1 TL-2023]
MSSIMKEWHPIYAEVPLKDPEKEIRLLTLPPMAGGVVSLYNTWKDNPLECRLECRRLDDVGPFEALSYVWNQKHEENTEHQIIVNGHAFQVSSNLYVALTRMSVTRMPRRVWVDAICINQNAEEAGGEKSVQVGIMRQIYSSTSLVVGWLGADGGPDQRDFEELFDYCNAKYPPRPEDTRGMFQVDKPFDAWARRVYSKENRKKIRDKIFKRSHAIWDGERVKWFGRMWIVQEAVLGEKVTLNCGVKNVWLTDIIKCIAPAVTELMDQKTSTQIGRAPDKVFGDHIHWLRIIKMAQLVEQRNENLRLSKLLVHCRNHDSVNPADKVFGLYGLAEEEVRELGLEPNYSIDDTLVCQWLLFDELVEVSGRVALDMENDADDFDEFLKAFDSLHQAYKMVCSNRKMSYPTGENDFTAYARTLCAGTLPKYRKSQPFGWAIVPDRPEREQTEENFHKLLKQFHRSWTVGQQIDNAIQTVVNAIERVRNFLPDRYRARADSEPWSDALIGRGVSVMAQEAYNFFLKGDGITMLSLFDAIAPTRCRNFAITTKGYFALVPTSVAKGDRIAILKGGNLPLVLRPRDKEFELLGESYVHGIMFGEQWNEHLCESIRIC